MPVTANRFLPVFFVAATIAPGIAQQAPETPQLAGRVTRSDTGAPIAGATIVVMPPFFEGAGFNFPTTTTDVSGNYSFETIRGQSVVSATADGFTFARYNWDGTPSGAARNFDSTTHLSGIDFELSPEAVIRGSVLTDDGHPVAAGVPVAAYKKPQTTGGKTSFATRTYTEANGSFTLSKLSAGAYIVVVNGPDEPLGYPTKDVSYRQKWYGNQATAENATELALKESDKRDGVNITVEPQTLYTVTVRPAGPDGRQAEGDYYWVSIKGRNTTSYGKNGGFTFQNIPAGHYTLKTEVRLGGMGGKLLGTQETAFDVTNADVTLHVTVSKQN
jgi:hypothetical protein